MNLGFQELLVIFLIVIILFGARKLPELARGMGQALREFRKAAKEAEDIAKTEIEEEKK
jgi:sec-independent protein translocase protein TatA